MDLREVSPAFPISDKLKNNKKKICLSLTKEAFPNQIPIESPILIQVLKKTEKTKKLSVTTAT